MIVEVIYATPTEQEILVVDLPDAATVESAIVASGVLKKYPEIDLQTAKVGIFSKATTLDQPLRENDRVEIYRPLIADPKEVRRRKAEQKAKKT